MNQSWGQKKGQSRCHIAACLHVLWHQGNESNNTESSNLVFIFPIWSVTFDTGWTSTARASRQATSFITCPSTRYATVDELTVTPRIDDTPLIPVWRGGGIHFTEFRLVGAAYCYRRSSVVCLSVGLSVGVSQSWAVQKRLNRSRYCLGRGLGWAQGGKY